MSEIIKKPYKITLWKDKNFYIVNKNKKTELNDNDTIQNQAFEEVCIATIGSDTMDTPIRAFNPVLTEELNGSKTLTFQINYKYWDDDEEDFKTNPFIGLLVNERKVKLYYDKDEDFDEDPITKNDGWYDFVIKQVEENSDSNTFTYTCKDLFVNELGKTGYEVELDTELRNNMGTITELANSILDGTDWKVDEEHSDRLIQRDKEGLYTYIVQEEIQGTPILGGEPVTIAPRQIILVFYSSKANGENPVQFLYKPIGTYSTVDEAIADFYKIDEYGFIINADNYEFTLIGDPTNFYQSLKPSKYFGQKILKKQEMHYLPQIDETCTVWEKNNNRYYCYTELEYSSVTQIQNMLSNGSGFISTNGWVSDGGTVALSTTTSGTISRAINISGSVYNTGFYDNRAALSPSGFIKGEKYILAVKGGSLGNSSTIKLVDKQNENSKTTILTFNKSSNDSTYSFTIPSELSGYNVKLGICESTHSYSSLTNDYGDIRFYLDFNGDLVDCKVFKYRLDSENKMIVPDLENDSNAIVQTRYNFFLEDSLEGYGSVYTKEDLNISESLLKSTSGYTPVMIDGHQKVTSITGSKSNRFNLIQSLCEVFECWAKFIIKHDEQGRIKYQYNKISSNSLQDGKRYYTWIGQGDAPSSNDNDSNFKVITENMSPSSYYEKVYSKSVIFKEYIGANNPVGFRYGINLQSIQRNIISDQIASKVIVQANSNEFAPNGSCTIQQSVLNPTGENALYNFQYFINQRLLDENGLYDDLYGMNGGIGFYEQMRHYNDLIKPLIDESTEISKSLYTLNSRQAVYDSLESEAEQLRVEAASELRASGYGISGGTNVPNYVKELRKKIQSYQDTKDHYAILTSRNRHLLDEYTNKYNGIAEYLKEIRAKKDKLKQDFENKYYQFIQEGTWNSEDYWDPELYYQAANMVLYTSSFPQISYSINVLELSQIEGFEPYTFKIADKTYIEDTEFFGYDSKGRPYKEEIVVSQVKRHLDDNSQNTITVQNYKTQFQDLFQRIAAASQTLQYHEGEFQRAASAINANGTISSALLQNSLDANALIIENANNQSVTWDETGITISNFVNANEIVRLTSGGIVLSSNGGREWTTGITGDGINADVITAGRIDTDRIRIFNKAMQQTFEWNSTGINAYMWDDTINNGLVDENNQPIYGAVDYGKFVRFDKHGIYGYAGGEPGWVPQSINDVISNSSFSLTWKGLSINVPNTQEVEDVININNGKFKVNKDGDVVLAGSITWTAGNSPTKILYTRTAEDATPKPNDNYNSFPNDYGTDNKKWHKTFNVQYDTYASYSYDGGNTWTDGIKIVGTDGQQGVSPTIQVVYSSSNNSTPTAAYDSGTYDSNSATWHKNLLTTDKYASYNYQSGTANNWNTPIKIKGDDAPQIRVLYSAGTENNFSKPTKDYTHSDYSSTNALWHRDLVSTDKYISYNYNSGTAGNWTEPIKLVGEDGHSAPEIRVYYTRDNTIGKPNNNNIDINDTNPDKWHLTFQANQDFYASYSYDDGDNWTDPIKIVGEDASEIKVLYSRSVTTDSEENPPTGNYNDYPGPYSSQYVWHQNLEVTDKYASYNYNNGVAGSWSEAIQIAASDILVLYATAILSTTPTKAIYDAAPSSGSTVWHTELQTDDRYASYSYNNGLNWTSPMKIVVDDAPDIKVLYTRSPLPKPTADYSTFYNEDNTTNARWHKEFNILSDIYASYNYKGGIAGEWTDRIQIVGSKGDKGDKGDTQEILVLYTTSNTVVPSKPTKSIYQNAGDSAPVSSPTDWHKQVSANDRYASYSYDGGETWTIAIKIVGSDAEVNKANIFNILTNNGSTQGLFSYANEEGTELYVNASYIHSGILDASNVQVINLDASNINTGTLSADRISGGTINANSISVTNLKVNNIVDSDGNSIAASNIIKSAYLSLKGMTITNSSGNTSFYVAPNGDVTINGNITMGAGSTIVWGSVSESGTSPYATTSSLSSYATKSSLSTVATSGKYTDLSNKPTIPTVPSYITSTKITSTTIETPTIKAATITLQNSSGTTGGYIYPRTGTSATTATELKSAGALALTASSGDVFISNASYKLQLTSGGTLSTTAKTISNSSSPITIKGTSTCTLDCTTTINGNLSMKGSIIPNTTSTSSGTGYALGDTTHAWRYVYCWGGWGSSDRRMKTNINYDLSDYEYLIQELKPVSFNFKEEENNKIHLGFIAQDVEKALEKKKINLKTTPFLLKEYDEEKLDYYYYLSYNDFIALQQWQIQKLESRISTLENLLSS